MRINSLPIKGLCLFTSDDLDRFHLSNICLSYKNGLVTGVATNGHILARVFVTATIDNEEPLPPFTAQFPATLVAKMLSGDKASKFAPPTVELSQTATGYMLAHTDGLQIPSVVNAPEFPDTDQVIPTEVEEVPSISFDPKYISTVAKFVTILHGTKSGVPCFQTWTFNSQTKAMISRHSLGGYQFEIILMPSNGKTIGEPENSHPYTITPEPVPCTNFAA